MKKKEEEEGKVHAVIIRCALQVTSTCNLHVINIKSPLYLLVVDIRLQ